MQVPSHSSDLQMMGDCADNFRAWRWKNVVIYCWVDQTTGPAARAFASISASLAKSAGPTKLSTIHLVTNNLSLPDAEARAVLGDVLRTQSAHLACVGAVLMGTGFWLSAIRSFITGLVTLTPRAVDLRVMANIDDLLAWFPKAHRARTGVELDETELRRHLDAVQDWSRLGRANLTSAGPTR